MKTPPEVELSKHKPEVRCSVSSSVEPATQSQTMLESSRTSPTKPTNEVSHILGKYLNTMVADLCIEGKGQYLRDLFSKYETELHSEPAAEGRMGADWPDNLALECATRLYSLSVEQGRDVPEWGIQSIAEIILPYLKAAQTSSQKWIIASYLTPAADLEHRARVFLRSLYGEDKALTFETVVEVMVKFAEEEGCERFS